MSALIKIIPNCLNTAAQRIAGQVLQRTAAFHSLTSDSTSIIKPGGLFDISTRNVIRIHFPRPSENKRIKRHGWKKRMSTPAGRRVLMNRILKGRWVYSH